MKTFHSKGETHSSQEASLHEVLIANGFTPHHTLADRERLSLKEKRTQYIMQLSEKFPTASFQIDGKIITEGNKCDFIILVKHNPIAHLWKEVFIELKGTDIKHAIEQLETTLKIEILQHPTINERKARIVALSFPSYKSNPTIELAKRRFLSSYRCELKSVKSGQPDQV